MPTACPSCSSSRTTTIDSRPITSGSRRRRHQCYVCHQRWTVFTDPQGLVIDPPRRPALPSTKGQRSKQRRLTPAQVRLILRNPDRSLNSLAAELGVSHEAVRLVRLGRTYREIDPGRSRQVSQPREGPDVTCLRCHSWVGGECTFGFPDPIEEGPEFAADCDLFTLRNDS